MDDFSRIKDQAMQLSVADRGKLASFLLRSLPSPGFDDDDDGVAEELRRDEEMENDPSTCMSFEEFKKSIGR